MISISDRACKPQISLSYLYCLYTNNFLLFRKIQENQVNGVLRKSLTFICENLDLKELAPYMVAQMKK